MAPLPSSLSVQQYRKYRKESKVIGASCGITSSGLRILFNTADNNASGGHGGGGKSSLAGDVAGGGISAFSSQQTHSATVGDNSSVAAGGSSVDGSSGGSGGGGGYGGLTGLMGRVLGAGSSSTATGGGANLSSEFYLLCILYTFWCDILFGRGAVEYL